MKTDIDTLLAFYTTYYPVHRREGHTRAAVEVAQKCGGILLTHSHRYAEDLAKQRVETAVWNQPEKLWGKSRAIVWDNAALVEVFAQASHTIFDLRVDKVRLERALETSEIVRKACEAKVEKYEARTVRTLFVATCKAVWRMVRGIAD